MSRLARWRSVASAILVLVGCANERNDARSGRESAVEGGATVDAADANDRRGPDAAADAARDVARRDPDAACESYDRYRCRHGVVDEVREPCEESFHWVEVHTCAKGCRKDLLGVDLWSTRDPAELCEEFVDGGADGSVCEEVEFAPVGGRAYVAPLATFCEGQPCERPLSEVDALMNCHVVGDAGNADPDSGLVTTRTAGCGRVAFFGKFYPRLHVYDEASGKLVGAARADDVREPLGDYPCVGAAYVAGEWSVDCDDVTVGVCNGSGLPDWWHR